MLNGKHRFSSSGRPLAIGEQRVGVLSSAFLRNLFFLAKLSLQKSPAGICILPGRTSVKDQDSRNSIGQAETEIIQKDPFRDRERISSCLRYMKDTQRLCIAREVPLNTAMYKK